MSNESLDELLRRIQGEYLEMPGLQLTPFQAQRLWALDREICATILEVLVDRQFLILGPDDRYRRVSDGKPLKRRKVAGRIVMTPATQDRPLTKRFPRHGKHSASPIRLVERAA